MNEETETEPNRQPADSCGSGHGAKLPRKREIAIAALLASPTVTAASAQIGCSERSLRKWMNNPSFAAEYAAARQSAITSAVGVLQAACGAAALALRSIATDEGLPPAARVSAARAVLENAFRGAELLELADRIEAVEASLAARVAK